MIDMRGLEYLTDRPMCQFPTLVPIPRRQGVGRGRERKPRNNDRRSSMDKTGQATRRRQRDLIIKTWGRVCHICWAKGITDQRAVIDLELAWPDPRCFTRDHMVPRSLGGSDDISNLRAAHNECNRDRNNALLESAS